VEISHHPIVHECVYVSMYVCMRLKKLIFTFIFIEYM